MRLREAARWVVLGCLVGTGCAVPSGDPDGADPGEPDEAAAAQTAASAGSCATSDQALFFHDLGHYGREIATSGLCAPTTAESRFPSTSWST